MSNTEKQFYNLMFAGSTNFGWVPSTPANQWIQVDLGEKLTITGVIVEGQPKFAVLTFTVQYSDTGESDDWQSLDDAQGETIQVSIQWIISQCIMSLSILFLHILYVIYYNSRKGRLLVPGGDWATQMVDPDNT